MNKKHNLAKRILSLVLAINLIIVNVCFDGIFPFSGIFHTTLKAEAAYTPSLGENDSAFDPGANGEISINSIAVLKDYAFHYSNSETFAGNHEDDILRLVLGASDTTIDSNYIPIGTSAHPFNGSLLFSTTNSTFDLNSQATLFDYVTDDAIIGGAVTLNLTNQAEDHVLIANHVKSGNHTAKWNLILASESVSYSGVIGEMLEEAEVELNFTDNSSESVSNSTGDAGIVCDTMQSGSKIVLSLTKSNSAINVSSTSGNAGALVGTMNSGSSLELISIPSASSSSTVTASGAGYAGGLVGYAQDASVSITSSGMTVGDTAGVTVIPVQGTVTASTGGAGGLFGYCENTGTGTFDLKDYNITATVYAENCGGVFGVLENNKGESTAIDLTIVNTGSAGNVNTSSGIDSTYAETGYYGGLIGKYRTDDLANSLILDGFTATSNAAASFCSYGGMIGIVDSIAYIKAGGVTVSATGSAQRDSSAYFGGLIGKTSESNGVFVDLGDFTLSADSGGFKGGGVVGSFANGVLRFSGITDMSSAKSQKGGQLIGKNDNVLVYALGTGSDYTAAVTDPDTGDVTTPASGWTFKRSNGSQIDDLGTWGEVVRVSGIESLLTVDGSNHTVTVPAAVTSISSAEDFVKTALNIQLNQGAGYDCLLFTPGSENTRDTLLASTTLSLSRDISLAGTGINGFMRDGGESVGTFTGTLNGNNKTISLAIGEVYGQDSTGVDVSSSSDAEGIGQIYAHPYNGLFAFIGDGTTGTGTVSSLTIGGNTNVHNKIDGMNIGGIAAVSTGNTTLTGVTASQTIKYKEPSAVTGTNSNGKNIGGLIGLANGSTNGTIAISGTSTINATFNISGNYKSWTCVGAAIGKVTSANFTINIAQGASDKLTVSHTMSVANGTSSGENADGGGLIGYITSGTYTNRIVNIKNLEFDGCTIVNTASKNAGGFLGYAWLDTDTTIDGLTVKSGTITNTTPNVGVMCYEATGKWTVNNLTVTKMSLPGGAGTSLGMLVNKAYSGNNGLYLDVLKAGYTLTDKSDDTGITLPASLGVYDELAAYSASNVINGGNGTGIVSINMNSDRTGTNVKITETGTYQNQLTSASSSALTSAKYANDKSRYYYNLDKMSNSDDGQNLLLWSVRKYAAGNIDDEFISTNDHSFGTTFDKTLSGTADLTGLSFYPLKNATDDYTLNGLKLTFDYSGIYSTAENHNDSDNYARDPGAATKNQHYLMHSGLFIDVQAGNTITITGTSSLGGNFLEIDSYKAALISGTMNGNLKITGSLELIGLTPKTTGGEGYTDGYLLVNNISRPDSQTQTITMELNDISTSGYSDKAQTAVAKSLVGPAEGRSLTFKFSGIKLDARKGTVSDTTVSDVNASLTTAYGTSRSIFSDATLVYSIYTDQYAELIYNYTRDEDWGSDGSGDRAVTYGTEITNSKEYAGQEKKYYGDPRNFTRPDADSNLEYTFSDTVFLPYVGVAYNPEADHTSKYYREIKVNVVTEVEWEGCGTYNDPYIIADGDQLETISKFLQSGNTDDIGTIILPIYNSSKFGGIENNISGDRWCTDKNGDTYHVSYTNNGTTGFTATGYESWSAADAQYYLAGAYYKITANIELDDNFMGLGGTTANTAFRGVIVGDTNESGEPGYTITNNTDKPFIWVTNGCVIKDVNIKINSNVSISQENNSHTNAFFGYNHTTTAEVCRFYGGIIGEIMGGDNIIDNSYVTFEKNKNITLSGSSGTIVPVGGYVGVVVFGGLIFKNIDASKTTLSATGLNVVYTSNTDNLANESNQEAWAAIYVNPLVGRVINGYAVNETGGNAKDANGDSVKQFSTSEDGKYHVDAKTDRTGAVLHALKNGKKHYTIADLNPDLDKLDVTAVPTSTSADGNIDVPNAQALFVLSLITQSTAGTATDDELGAYNTSLSYGTYTENNATIVYGMSHNAEYSDVGTNTALIADNPDTEDVDERNVTDYQKLAYYDTANNVDGNSSIPYIIKYYTTGGTTTGTITRMETRTRTVIETVTEDVTHYSTSPYESTTTVPVGTGLLISGHRNTNEYLTNIRWNSTNKRNYVLRSTKYYTTTETDLTLAETKITKAIEVYIEKHPTESKYCIYYLYEDSNNSERRKYLNITDVYYDKDNNITDTNKARGNVDFSDDPMYFTIEYKTSGKGAGWTIRDSSNRYINYSGDSTNFCAWTNVDEGSYLSFSEKVVTTTQESHEETHEEEYEVAVTEYATTHNYPARCVTSTAGYYDINLTNETTGYVYQLPDSFRGLGCVGNNNTAYEIKLDKFDGKGCTVDEDIYLNKFQTDNYFNVIHSTNDQATNSGKPYHANKEIANNDHHGIGMFDSVKTSGPSSVITDFTLSGSVNTEIYKNAYNESSKELVVYANDAANFISVGGICGSTNDSGTYLTFDQINLNSVSVCGSCVVGGLLGYSNNQNPADMSKLVPVIVNKCIATDLMIKMNSTSALSNVEQPRNSMGGFIGKCVEGNVQIKGDTTNRSSVTIKAFGFEAATDVTDHRAVAGGLVGYAGNGCTVSDMNVSPTSGVAIEIGSDYTGYAGGLVGLMQPSTGGGVSCIANFKNCTVEKINVNGHYAGGFYGGKWFGNNNTYVPYSITLDNCKILGDSTANNTIKGNSLRDVNGYAGGFLGCGNVYKDGSPNIEIKDCLVSHYTITSTAYNNGQKGYVGGFIGYTGSSENNSSIVCYIHDSSVENCTIGSSGNYAGGAIGQVTRRNGNDTKNKILGYNIKLDTVTLGGTYNGAWIGNVESSDSTTSIQFTGVGIYGNGFTQNVGNRSTFAKASFVFADYDGACASYNTTTNPVSGLNCDDHSSTSTSHVEMPKYPYVNINPQSALGSTQIISGDGAVLIDNGVSGYTSYTSANTMAAKLYADIEQETSSRRYTTFVDDPIADGNRIQHYLQQTTAGAGDRISTWKTEMGEMPSNDVKDFAMIVIANEEPPETTALINRYIQLVTNTATDYSLTSDFYTVEPKACVYNSTSGNFEITNGTPSISYNPAESSTNAFTVNRAGADSLTLNKFTLLDVQFMDPLNTSKVAYHLYVPVYVKRSISATFSSTALSGTNALASDYTGYLALSTNHRLIENLDNWITVYIRYQYSADDINAVLDSGMLDWNSSKEVDFAFGTNATGTTLPNGTQLVLIDPNGDIDEAYYAKGSDLTDKASSATEFQFSLSDFNKKLDGSGKSFAEQYFSKILDANAVTVTELAGTENEGTGYYNRVPAEQADDNTIKVGDYCYSYVSNKTGNYSLTASGAFSEDYYISMLVPSDEYIYLFDVLAPATLSGKMTTIVSHTSGVNPHAEILLGDLFEQTFDTTSVTPSDEVMTESDHTITVNVTSTVKLKAAEANIREYYASYLGTTPLYHADVVTFTRHDANGSDMTINGGTTITSSGTVDNTPVSTVASLVGSYVMVKTGDIRNQVIQGANQQDYDGATITQTISVTFLGYEDEFPSRPSDQERYGVNPSISSNISYDEDGLTFSGKKISHDFNKRYYVEKANTAIITYEADDERDNYDSVGFSSFNNSRLSNNGLDRSSTCTYTDYGMPINATAVYNAALVANYDSAESIVYTLTLFKKTDTVENGVVTKVSYEQVDIDYYLKNVKVYGGKTGTTELTKTAASGDRQYVYSELVSEANENAKMFTIGTYFEVVTGGDFQDYANYRVVLEAHLLTESGAAISNSVVKDYIVYTNAKIWPEVIQLSEP